MEEKKSKFEKLRLSQPNSTLVQIAETYQGQVLTKLKIDEILRNYGVYAGSPEKLEASIRQYTRGVESTCNDVTKEARLVQVSSNTYRFTVEKYQINQKS